MTQQEWIDGLDRLRANLGPAWKMRARWYRRGTLPPGDHFEPAQVRDVESWIGLFDLGNDTRKPDLIVQVQEPPRLEGMQQGQEVDVFGDKWPGGAVAVRAGGVVYWPAYPALANAWWSRRFWKGSR